jgi:hypothetical protein
VITSPTYVQRQVTFSPPMSVATLRHLLEDLPAEADVDILDGELIAVNWQREELAVNTMQDTHGSGRDISSVTG